MNIAKYIDSTYLKTPEQSGLSPEETKEKVLALATEAHKHQLFAVMIRPEYISSIKEFLTQLESSVKVGTVIGFHEGTASLEEKLKEAEKAIADGADELDFVINFEAFKKGEVETVEKEVLECTRLGIAHGKVVKWIIEIAALSNEEIKSITELISNKAQEYFSSTERENIFVKSSTGFYPTTGGAPNGATVEGIQLMKAHAGDLPLKAAGGVRTPKEAQEMIELGVTRIGTSSALALLGDGAISSDY